MGYLCRGYTFQGLWNQSITYFWCHCELSFSVNFDAKTINSFVVHNRFSIIWRFICPPIRVSFFKVWIIFTTLYIFVFDVHIWITIVTILLMSKSNGMDKFVDYDPFFITSPSICEIFSQSKNLPTSRSSQVRTACGSIGSYHLDIVFFIGPFSVLK